MLALAWGAPLLAAKVSRPPVWSNAQFWIDDTHAGHYQVSHARFYDNVRFLHIIFVGPAQDKPYYKVNAPPAWAFKLTQAMQGEGLAAGKVWWGVDTLATGWPLRAFRGGLYEPWPVTQPATPVYNFVIDGTGGLKTVQQPPAGPLVDGLYRFGGKAKDKYAIPLHPIAKGLALNIVFFAAAWGLLGLACGRVRRWRRTRRGRCGACGYDLQGLAAGATCPECGRPSRGAATHAVS
jgi:hypothetical protein